MGKLPTLDSLDKSIHQTNVLMLLIIHVSRNIGMDNFKQPMSISQKKIQNI